MCKKICEILHCFSSHFDPKGVTAAESFEILRNGSLVVTPVTSEALAFCDGV